MKRVLLLLLVAIVAAGFAVAALAPALTS